MHKEGDLGMQWTSEQVQQWEELRPYVDTALLPLYLYRRELPVPRQFARMTALANVSLALEQRLRGRVLQLPLSYQGDGQNVFFLPPGFPIYVILRFAGDEWRYEYEREASEVHTLSVWEEDVSDPLRFLAVVDVLAEAISEVWQRKQETAQKDR